jgi:hypothetical protein
MKFFHFLIDEIIFFLHTSIAMKLHTLIITSALSATAFAGEISSTSASSPERSAYLDVNGLYNNFTQGLEANGFRINGGFDLGYGLSLDGRFENAYTDEISGSGEGSPLSNSELKFNELRALVHYTQDVSNEISLVGGLGYGKLGFSYTGIDFVSTEGLLADIGVMVQSGKLSAGLTYTHLFAMHTASFLGAGSLEDEDIGLIEGSLGYQVNENVSLIGSIQTQVLGDTVIEKELGATLGLRYNF